MNEQKLAKIERIVTTNEECEENLDKINRIMQDNLDLPYEFASQLLLAQEEVAAGKVEPFEFGQIQYN